MGDNIMKKISKRNSYQFLSVFIFIGAIFSLLKQNIGLGYVLIILGYILLRKSDLEIWVDLISEVEIKGW